MQSLKADEPRRPAMLHTSRSFSRLESPQRSPASPSRTRATTLATPIIPSIPEARHISTSPEERGKSQPGDIFVSSEEQDEHLNAQLSVAAAPEIQQPESFEQLPIEIRSFSERFLKSLSTKAHAAPLTIDAVSDLFQDFYVQAESHISTHVAALSARLSREKLAAPSAASKGSVLVKGRARANSKTDKDATADGLTGDQQMLTASEITNRRKARRMLELKQLALEEAVERGVCEKVYDRIYRHRSTDDEERDASLRSKTAALALVGIGLKELHVDIQPLKNEGQERIDEKKDDIHELLSPARESLYAMDSERFPLGKLQHLTAAHKSIVETLSQLFPKSSSADEVLPTLIYTLITSTPDSINVVSNLHFIQRFRASAKMDGEAAYCLVNLEAAISFLETVDLSSLRSDEAPEGPLKQTSRPSTPNLAKAPGTVTTARPATPGLSPISATSTDVGLGISGESKALMSPSIPSTPVGNLGPTLAHQRRLSSLIQQQADRIEAGRENFLSQADQAFDSINTTLENSFKFLFGRLNEQNQVDGQGSPIIIPKTLEDAQRLVSSPHHGEDDELEPSLSHVLESENISISRSSSAAELIYEGPDDPLSKTSKKMLELVGGRNALRERSVDSARSAGSGKRVGFVDKAGDKAVPTPSQSGAGDAVGNFVSALNPLGRFAVPGFARFGRSVSGPAPPSPVVEKADPMAKALEKDGVQTEVDLSAVETLAELKKTKPPLRRFLEVDSAAELRIGDVEVLLRDYKRLSKVLGEAVNS